MNELFEKAAGFPVEEFDLFQLALYVNAGDEEDTLYLIDEMAEGYPDFEAACAGFTVVWDYLTKI